MTSHMLDTSVGRPAHNVLILLERLCEGSVSVWERVGQGTTNADGRVGDLMPPADMIEAGVYRLVVLVQLLAGHLALHACARHDAAVAQARRRVIVTVVQDHI